MRLKNAVLQALKIVVSLGLIIFLLRRRSPQELASYLNDLDPLLMISAVGVFFLSSLLGAVQWHVLLRAGGIDLAFQRSFRFYFVGLFFNNFLPANVGGDAIKIFDVVKKGNDPHKVFAVTLLDRVFGITGLCLLAAGATLALMPGGTIDSAAVYLALFGGIIFSVVVLAFSRRLSGWVRRGTGRIRIWRIGEKIELVLSHLGEMRDLRPLFGRLILLTLVIQALRIFTHVLVGRSLGIAISGSDMIHFYVFVPLLGLVMMLPISINGLGVRESAGIVLFTQIGILEGLAVLMEFLTYVVQVLVSLIGAAFFFMRRVGRK